jgi:3-oxoacyl-[acyl-carrier protein] reductase
LLTSSAPGKTAIITGSARGIGGETAAIFAREGCKVVISDIDEIKAAEKVREIREQGGASISVTGDITDNQYIERLVQQSADFGSGSIHILVNNAGYAWDDSIENIKDEQWGESGLPS